MEAQYDNGGWPQFYPVRPGNVAYSGHITFNDDAMVNTMRFLKELLSDNADFRSMNVSKRKKNSLAEIGHERRNGYSWYTRAPEKMLEKYPEWKKRNGI